MTVTALLLLVAGALLVTTGAAFIYWPAGLVVAGLCVGLFGWNLLPDGSPGSRR